MANDTAAMPLLRMRNACFTSEGSFVGPITFDLCPGERAAKHFSSAYEASTIALMAVGIVKASSGCVLIGDFDPRVQPVHCKRIAAFVPHEPLALSRSNFSRYVAYRAALWNLNAQLALQRAAALRERLRGVDDAIAYPFIAALIGMPQILILDRPQPPLMTQLHVAGECAVFSTHATA